MAIESRDTVYMTKRCAQPIPD